MASTPTPTTNIVTTNAPTNKAVAATAGSAFGGAVAVLLIAGLNYLLGFDVSDQVANAITVIVTTLVTLGAAYFTPPSAGELVVTGADGKAKTARIVTTQ